MYVPTELVFNHPYPSIYSSSSYPSELQEAVSPKHSFLQRKVPELPAPTWEIGVGHRDESGAIRLAWKPPPRTSVGSHIDDYRVEWRVGKLTTATMITLEKAGDWGGLPEDQVQPNYLRCASRRGTSSTEVTVTLPEIDFRQIEFRVRARDHGADCGGYVTLSTKSYLRSGLLDLNRVHVV